jgi:A118 family predicted phage portal protein
VISLKFPVLRLSNRYDWHDNVPIYYPSVKKIEDTNKIYAEMMLDVILGRKMILLPEDTANRLKKERSPDGSNFSYINASNLPTVFERFNAGDEVGDNGIVPQIYDSVIRPDKYIETINFQLNLIAVEVGLGAGYFSFEGSKGLRTATEVVSERTDLNINRKNLTQHLDKLIVWMGHQLGATDVEVQMYDNVIEDDSVRKKQLHMDMQARLLNLDWYLKEMYGLTEEEIKEARSQMIGDGE